MAIESHRDHLLFHSHHSNPYAIQVAFSIKVVASSVSHLFFADDSIIFCRATLEECKQVAEVLDTYEKVSGQKINKYKTSLFFSKNTRGDIQDGVKNMFGAQIVQQHEKYLGLPPMVGRGKKKALIVSKTK